MARNTRNARRRDKGANVADEVFRQFAWNLAGTLAGRPGKSSSPQPPDRRK